MITKERIILNKSLKNWQYMMWKKQSKELKILWIRIKENGYNLENYKGYKFYKENPSLSIWEIIEKILYECGLYSKL